VEAVRYHERDIEVRCIWFGCKSTAKREILNQFNGHVGYYCIAHADRRLKELNRAEPLTKEESSNDEENVR
jgi:hypothetical protein